MTPAEHKGPLMVIAIFGLMALAAVGIAGTLAIRDHQMEAVLAFTGLATTVGAWLAPSPMTKLPAPPTPPGALLVSGAGSNGLPEPVSDHAEGDSTTSLFPGPVPADVAPPPAATQEAGVGGA